MDRWFLRPWVIVALALTAGAIGGLVQALADTDAVVTGVIAAATLGYAMFTIRLVRATEHQSEIVESQVGILRSQLDQERLAHEGTRAARAEDLLRGEQVFRESIKSQRDSRMPTVVISRGEPRLHFYRREQAANVMANSLAALDPADPNSRCELSVPFFVSNYGPGPAFVFVAHVPVGSYDFEERGDASAWLRTFEVVPNGVQQLEWIREANVDVWREWALTGLGDRRQVSDNPWMVEFAFQSQSAFGEVVDDHVLRAEVNALVLHDGVVVEKAVSETVNSLLYAVVTRSYPGL